MVKRLTSHQRKHLKRLRTGLLGMRERITKRLESFSGYYYSESSIAEKREEVKAEKALIRHIDPILERIQRTLSEAPLVLEPPPRVSLKKYKPKKRPPLKEGQIEGTFTIER